MNGNEVSVSPNDVSDTAASAAAAADSWVNLIYSPHRSMTDTVVDSTYMIWHFSFAVSKNRTSKRHSPRSVCWLCELVVFRFDCVDKYKRNSNKSKWFPSKRWMLAKSRPNTQKVDSILKIVVGKFGPETANTIFIPEIALSYRMNGNVTSTIDRPINSSSNFPVISPFLPIIQQCNADK